MFFLNYTKMKIAHLSRTSPNMSSIGEVCDRLGKTFLTSLVGNLWAIGGLRVNSTPDYNLPLVPLKGNTILPITLKAERALYTAVYHC